MRHGWLVLLASCSSNAPTFIDAYVDVRTIEADVVVYGDYVRVFSNDLNCDCGGHQRVFPQPHTCVEYEDFFDCPCESLAACLTEVSVDGVRSSNVFVEEAYYMNVATNEASTLLLRGCGHEATIPLHSSGLPSATVELVVADDVYTVSWITDRPVPTAIASISNFTSLQCHDVGVDQHSFTSPTPNGTVLGVQPLLPVETVVNEMGTIRVWRGGVFSP